MKNSTFFLIECAQVSTNARSNNWSQEKFIEELNYVLDQKVQCPVCKESSNGSLSVKLGKNAEAITVGYWLCSE